MSGQRHTFMTAADILRHGQGIKHTSQIVGASGPPSMTAAYGGGQPHTEYGTASMLAGKKEGRGWRGEMSMLMVKMSDGAEDEGG